MTKPISNNANDFFRHPVYDKWEANRDGVVRHIANKKDIGSLSKSGYIHIFVTKYQGTRKNYYKHRFIFECFHGKINDVKLIVDHINNIKIDNRIDNLQLISQSQNMIKENRKGKKLPPISVRATNIDTGESSEYYSIYDCSRKLDINDASISRVLKGSTNSATSKIDKNKYTFEKIEKIEYKQKGVKRPPIRVRAIKIDTGKTSDYDSIYKCCSALDVNRSSVYRIVLQAK